MRKHHRELERQISGAPGPHDFAVHKSAARQSARLRPPHPRLTCRDDRDTPLREARRDKRRIRLIRPSKKAKYFCARGLTGIHETRPTGKSVESKAALHAQASCPAEYGQSPARSSSLCWPVYCARTIKLRKSFSAPTSVSANASETRRRRACGLSDFLSFAGKCAFRGRDRRVAGRNDGATFG